jgi:hypothetical protein
LTGCPEPTCQGLWGEEEEEPQRILLFREKVQRVLLLMDTSYHNGLGGYPTWNNIYEKFLNGRFPLEDDDLGIYRNIKKSGLYVIALDPPLCLTMMRRDGCFHTWM